MASTTAIGGNPTRNNGATIMGAGNIDSSTTVTNNQTLLNNAFHVYDTGPFLAVSPDSSSNIGTTKALSAGVFAQMETGQYVGKIIGTRIAQTDDTFLRSGAAESNGGRRMLNYSTGYRQLDHTSWDYVSGAVTKGGSKGTKITFIDGADGTTQAQEPFPTNAVPGNLTYRIGASLPTDDNYKARTNP